MRTKAYCKSFPILILVAGMLAGIARAETPFNYQGQLSNSGTPQDGTVEMTFRLWDAPTGGTQIGADITQTVEVVDGLFQVVLDFGSVFDGSFVALEIEVEGAPLEPRQALVPVPMALLAVDVMPGQFWRQGGNSGTDPGDILGTSDFAPLEVHVDGQRALRIEPVGDATQAPNLIGGIAINSIAEGVMGGTIAGGGKILSGIELPNAISGGNYSAIGGGSNNAVDGTHATIAGGSGNSANRNYAAIGGGRQNQLNGSSATIAGGAQNTAHGNYSAVGGGVNNSINSLGWYATIPGGRSNVAGASYTFAAGRRARAIHDGTFVWADSTDADFQSTGENQFLVRAGGGSIFDSSVQAAEMQLTSRGAGDHPLFPERWTLASVRQSGSAIPVLHFHGPEHSVIGDPGSVFRLEAVSGQATFGRADKSMDLTVHGQVTAHERVRLMELDGSGSTGLCLNAGNYIANCSSSRRYKQDIATLENATALVEQLRPVRYRWKDGNIAAIGLVAEEVAEIDPRLVTFNAHGRIEGVRYRQLSALLVRALQEQRTEAARMRSEIAALRTHTERLDQLIQHESRLEARLLRVEKLLSETGQPAPGN